MWELLVQRPNKNLIPQSPCGRCLPSPYSFFRIREHKKSAPSISVFLLHFGKGIVNRELNLTNTSVSDSRFRASAFVCLLSSSISGCPRANTCNSYCLASSECKMENLAKAKSIWMWCKFVKNLVPRPLSMGQIRGTDLLHCAPMYAQW